MENIITWCNSNEGFISATLSILTILISVLALVVSRKIGSIPYRKQLAVIPTYYHNEDNEPVFDIMLVNYGLTALVIKHISILDEKKECVSSTVTYKPIILEPSKYRKIKLVIDDYNGLIYKNAINLNKK